MNHINNVNDNLIKFYSCNHDIFILNQAETEIEVNAQLHLIDNQTRQKTSHHHQYFYGKQYFYDK